MNKFQQVLCLAAVFVAALWPGAAAASTVYTVTANTSSIAGQDGYLDLQFEPGPAATNLATVIVSGFATDGSLTGAATLTGDASGQLPGTLNFDNQTVLNDYFQETTFGTTETFAVTLSGPTPLGGSPSAFNISFYGADGVTPELTVSPDGEAGQITLNSNGTTSVQTYMAAVGVASALTITPELVAPEPASVGLMGLSLGLLAALWSRRKRMIRRNGEGA